MRSTQTLLYSEIAVNPRLHAEESCQIHLKEHAEVGRNEVFHVEFELNLEAGTLYYLSLAVEADYTDALCPITLQLLHLSRFL